jgi:hypothetical protein
VSLPTRNKSNHLLPPSRIETSVVVVSSATVVVIQLLLLFDTLFSLTLTNLHPKRRTATQFGLQHIAVWPSLRSWDAGSSPQQWALICNVLPPFSSVSSFIEVPGEEIPIIAIAIVVLLVRIDLKMLSKGWVMDVLVWLWRSAGHMLSGEVATAPGLESHTV